MSTTDKDQDPERKGNRLSKIVTRTGDAGTTGLGDGSLQRCGVGVADIDQFAAIGMRFHGGKVVLCDAAAADEGEADLAVDDGSRVMHGSLRQNLGGEGLQTQIGRIARQHILQVVQHLLGLTQRMDAVVAQGLELVVGHDGDDGQFDVGKGEHGV